MYGLNTGDLFCSRFKIVKKLGKGGMGEVYLARQLDVERDVALKILPLERVEKSEDRERFVREFKLLSQLKHINIMAFYGIAMSEDGLPYAICEYLPGDNLESLISKEGSFSLRRVLRISIQICQALAAAHNLGIVHRDLKPENVMLMAEPEPDFVKLIDFGLSFTVETSATVQKLTFTGQLLGTPHYMSPEQCAGERVDARSDIYSLACLMFELLTGQKIVSADTPIGALYQQRNMDARLRLSEYSQVIPEKLRELLLKMLDKMPAKRCQSMNEVQSVLESILAETESMTASQAANHSGWKVSSRQLLFIALIAFGLTAAAFAVGYFADQRSKLSRFTPLSRTGIGAEKSLPLVPRSGFLAKVRIDRFRDARDFDNGVELALTWLKKYGTEQNAVAVEKAAVLHAAFEVVLGKYPPRDRYNFAPQAEQVLKSLETNRTNEALPLRLLLMQDLAVAFFGNKEYEKCRRAVLDAYELLLTVPVEKGGTWTDARKTAKALAYIGYFAKARDIWQKYYEFFERNTLAIGNSFDTSSYFHLGGDLAVLDGEFERALKYYSTAYDSVVKGETETYPVLFNAQCELVMKVGYLSKPLASKFLVETIKRARSRKNRDTCTSMQWIILGQLCRDLGLANKAELCAREALAALDYTFEGAQDSTLMDRRIEYTFYFACELMKNGKEKQALELMKSAALEDKRKLKNTDLTLARNFCASLAVLSKDLKIKNECLQLGKKSLNRLEGSKNLSPFACTTIALLNRDNLEKSRNYFNRAEMAVRKYEEEKKAVDSTFLSLVSDSISIYGPKEAKNFLNRHIQFLSVTEIANCYSLMANCFFANGQYNDAIALYNQEFDFLVNHPAPDEYDSGRTLLEAVKAKLNIYKAKQSLAGRVRP